MCLPHLLLRILDPLPTRNQTDNNNKQFFVGLAVLEHVSEVVRTALAEVSRGVTKEMARRT